MDPTRRPSAVWDYQEERRKKKPTKNNVEKAKAFFLFCLSLVSFRSVSVR